MDLRLIKVVEGENQPLEIDKTEKATTGVDRTIETTIAEINADHMTLSSSHPTPSHELQSSLSSFHEETFG